MISSLEKDLHQQPRRSTMKKSYRSPRAISGCVVCERIEPRRLLAFSPAGAPVQVDPPDVNVTAVSTLSGLADGRHVVAYLVSDDLYVRLYDGAGQPVAPPQKVNTAGPATSPDVAITSDGSFVVTWQQADSDQAGVYARRFAGTGVAVAAPFMVNTTVTGEQTQPRIGIDGSGNFTIVYQSDDGSGPRILAQRFTNTGVPDGSESLVSANEDSTTPDIAMNSSGQAVVVWTNSTNTLAQRIAPSGSLSGAIITVDNEINTQPSVGIATNGNFVIAWSVDAGGGEKNIVYTRYNNAGTVIGSTAQLATSNPAGDEQFPQVNVAGSGKFVISWAEASTTPGTFNQIGFRAFTASAADLGTDTLINDVGFGPETRHGSIFLDNTPVRVAYLSNANALVQAYQNQLVIDLGNTNNVLQIFGTGGNLLVRENGSDTTYDAELFTGIVVNGGTANDYIRVKNTTLPVSVYGNAGNDTIITAEGNDYVEGGLGNDAINLGDGNDYAIGNDETDTLYGGNGNDTLTGGPGRNLMYGEAGDDLLGGGNRPDTLYGGPGNDRMLGRAGGDALFGEDDNDILDGGTGNDGLLGGDGNDSLIGGPGNDTLRGGRGDDTLRGDNDIDRLYGDAGSDLLDGGLQGDYGYADALDILISIEVRRRVP